MLDENVRLNFSGKTSCKAVYFFLKIFPPLFLAIELVMAAFWDRNATLESRHDDLK